MNKVKKTLDKMGWSGWLVVERSRDKDGVRNVRKNYGTNIEYLKKSIPTINFIDMIRRLV